MLYDILDGAWSIPAENFGAHAIFVARYPHARMRLCTSQELRRECKRCLPSQRAEGSQLDWTRPAWVDAKELRNGTQCATSPARTDRKAVRSHARSVRLLSVTCIAVEVRDLAKRTHTHVAPMRVDDALEERSVTNTAEAHETQNRSYKASRRHGSSIGTAGRFARKVAPAWRTVDQISEELDGPVLRILTKRRTPHLPT